MTSELDALVAWAGRACGEPARVDRLSSVLLWGRPPDGSGAVSALNNDGTPLQACLTFEGGRRRLRLVGDPAAAVVPPDRRFRLARRALRQVLRLTGADTLSDTCDQTLQRTLPRRKGTQFQSGAVWLAAGLDAGAALYVNMRWGQPGDRWDDAQGWLGALLPESAASRALVEVARNHAVLASVGVEGRGRADARLKLYWRLDRGIPLHETGIALFADEAFRDFLAEVVRDDALSRQGLVLSAGFALSDGALRDAKLDLCAHCLPRTAEQWTDVLGRCEPAARAADLQDGLHRRQCELAFVGLGVDCRRTRRLNVYLKPAASWQ
jgi:hypothetical protein